LSNERSPEEEEQEPVSVRISGTSELDTFWKECGKKMITDSIDKFDERAKFMITTCATLIVINFGLLLAFPVQGVPFEIAPPLFFAVAAAIFAISYFPAGPRIYPLVPDSISRVHSIMFGFKLRCHYVGLSLFICGLFLLGISNMIGEGEKSDSASSNLTMTKAIEEKASNLMKSIKWPNEIISIFYFPINSFLW
jgi:hypothetical protein